MTEKMYQCENADRCTVSEGCGNEHNSPHAFLSPECDERCTGEAPGIIKGSRCIEIGEKIKYVPGGKRCDHNPLNIIGLCNDGRCCHLIQNNKVENYVICNYNIKNKEQEMETKKYKVLKPINLANLSLDENIDDSLVGKFHRAIGGSSTFITDRVMVSDKLKMFIFGNQYTDIFISQGYIEEIKPEMFYAVGDTFEDQSGIYIK